MAIIGFNFTKIDAEKTGSLTGKVNINNNVMVTDAKQVDIGIAPKGSKGMIIKFKYTSVYEPNVGKINLEGDMILMEKEDLVKKAVDSWQKNKSLDKDLSRPILSNILGKATVEAIVLSKELGLPAPIPLPKIGEGSPAKTEAKKK